jgi:glycosyltransferase involved in cell wall biosynthesis
MRGNSETSDLCFLVFSDDWGEHPSSCQHLFRIIGRTYPVLWVNTVGMRTPRPTLTDAGKALRKLRRMIFGAEARQRTHSENLSLFVCHPPMLPFAISSLSPKVNRISVIHAVRKRLAELGMKRPLLVTTVPNASDYVGACDEKRVVYYCVDDFSEWPNYRKSLISKMERELIDKSDVLIATSRKLFDKLSIRGKPSYLLTHGVDLDHFTRKPGKEHSVLHNIPKPRVGYFGLFDGRTDQDLLANVAERMPGVSFVITGPLDTDVSSLKALSNVYFTGSVPYSELVSVVGGWEACILPYAQSELTRAINPLKLKEYLATGKPIISTPIPEACRVGDLVHIAETAEEWIEMIRTSLLGTRSKDHAQRNAFLVNESWEKKAGQFLKMVLSG